MKLRVWQTLILVLVVGVFSALGFSACGGPRDGLSLNIESEKITQDENGNKVISLVKEFEDGVLTKNGYATIIVKVENGASSLDRTVSAIPSSDAKVSTSTTFDPENGTNTVVVSAVGATASNNSTFITIQSNEDSTLSERIYIQVKEKATEMKYSSGIDVIKNEGTAQNPDQINNYAVFTQVGFVFNTDLFFDFSPQTAITPNIVYKTNVTSDHIYRNGDTLKLPNSNLTEIIVTAYDADNPSDETFQKVFKMSILKNLMADEISINRIDTAQVQADIEEIDLIMNFAEKENTAILEYITVLNGVGLKLDLDRTKIITDEIVGEPNKVKLIGANYTNGTEVNFTFSYSGIKNSPQVTKTIVVKVVDYPEAIKINDQSVNFRQIPIPQTEDGYYGYYYQSGTSGNFTYTLITTQNFASFDIEVGITPCFEEVVYELTVFDYYSADEVGARLVVELVKFSEGYGNYTLEVENADELAQNLKIICNEHQYSFVEDVGGVFEVKPLTFASGDVLTLFTSLNQTGTLNVKITAVSKTDQTQKLTRNLTLVFTAGIDEIILENVQDKVFMEVGEKGLDIASDKKVVNFSVSPDDAAIKSANITYVDVSSSDTNVASVSEIIVNAGGKGEFVITAKKVGKTLITLTAKNGVSKTFEVEVKALLNTVTLEAKTNSQNTFITMKDDAIDSTKRTLNTLTTVKNESINLKFNLYPKDAKILQTKFFLGELQGTDIVKTTQEFSGAYDDSTSPILNIFQNGNSAWISTREASKDKNTEYIVVEMTYEALDDTGVNFEQKTITQTFSVTVFEPISSVKLSTDRIELIESGNGGYYNDAKQKSFIEVTINPSLSTVGVSEAVWSVKGGGSYYLDMWDDTNDGQTKGSKVYISAKKLLSGESSVTVQVQVEITDLNGKVYDPVVDVIIKKLVPVGTLTIGSYDDSEGIYFETTKGLSSLPVTETPETVEVIDRLAIKNSTEESDVVPQSQNLSVNIKFKKQEPTNPNLEYFVFDADENFNVINDGVNPNRFYNSSIWLGYDVKNGKYFVTPISSGYSLLVVVPQDKLSKEASEISWADIEGITNKLTLKITVADGYETYFRVYDAQDIEDIANSEDAWDKNYYIMNDIDVTSCNQNKTWTSIGNKTKPFTGTMTSYSTITRTIYGFDLQTNGSEYFGIFGVIGTGVSSYKDQLIPRTGTIQNLNFEIYNLNVTNGSYVGSLAGYTKLGVIVSNVQVTTKSLELNCQNPISVGTIGKNETNGISNVNVNFNAKILESNSNSSKVVMGGLIAENSADINSLSVNVNIKSEDANCISSNSIFGGAVGTSTKLVKGANVTGLILLSEKSQAMDAGGVVGQAKGGVEDCTSSVVIANAQNVGGIVGEAMSNITNCVYEIFELSGAVLQSNLVQTNNIFVGGLAGSISGGKIEYSYVVSFSNENLQQLSSKNAVGGLVGRAFSGVVISKSFFKGSISGGQSVGGLVGLGTANIDNSFVAGSIEADAFNAGHFVGNLDGSRVTISNCYSVLSTNKELNATTNGTANISGVYVAKFQDGQNSDTGIIYKTLEEMKIPSTFTNFDFVNIWKFNNELSYDYPILKDKFGNDLYPIIPTKLNFTAKDLLQDKNVYVATDKNIIIVLSDIPSKYLKLTDLFDFSVVPNQSASQIKVSVVSSNTSAIVISGNVGLDSIYLNVMGVGHSMISITSKYNPAVYDILGIQIVRGYDDLKLYQSSDDKDKDNAQTGDVVKDYEITTQNPLMEIAIQTGHSNEWFLNYLDISNIQDEDGNLISTKFDISASNIGGGVSFVLEEGYAVIGEDKLGSLKLTQEKLLKTILSLCYDKESLNYDLEKMNTAFKILSEDVNAKVELNAGIYTFVSQGLNVGQINKDTTEFIGTNKDIKLKRSAIISLANNFAFSGTLANGYLFGELESDVLEGYLAKAQFVLSKFYQRSSASLENINGTDYVVYNVEGYNLARIYQQQAGFSYNFKTEVFMYVENTNIASVFASKSAELKVTMVPYFKGEFNKLDGKQILDETQTEFSILWDKTVEFNLIIYQGATNLGLSNSGGQLEISQNFSLDVTLESDSPNDQQYGTVVEVFEENKDDWNLVASRNLNKGDAGMSMQIEDDYISKYSVNFSDVDVEGNLIKQTLEFGILEDYKKYFSQETRFKVVVKNYQFVENSNIFEKTIYFTYLPQLVEKVFVTHFADAELEGENSTAPGNYLTNAGAEPSDTILTGEMGLLRINLTPEYAQFDSVTITSNVVNGDSVSFQQRVMGTRIVSGVTETRYYFYEEGVSYVPNGIKVARVSNEDKTFDGTIWLQTLIAKQSTTAGSFEITIKVEKEGFAPQTFNYTLTVDTSSNIILSYDASLDEDSIRPKAFVAVGTGGSSQKDVNKNILTITQVGTFEGELEVSIINDTTSGKVKIENTGGKYYIIVSESCDIGSTFSVQVQGIKYVNGYRRTITRTMDFTITDFVLKNNSITISGVKNGTFNKPYYKNASYKLDIGYDLNFINANTNIAKVKQNLNKLVEKLTNGEINVWSILDSKNNIIMLEEAGTLGAEYVYAKTRRFEDKVVPKTSDNPDATNAYSVINNSFYIRLVTNDGGKSGWYICPVRQSTESTTLVFNDLHYIFDSSALYRGQTSLSVGNASVFFTVASQNISVIFSQQTSLDSPIPINTIQDLMEMEENKDYRLMADLDTQNMLWTPLNIAIKSLDGNGHTITLKNFNTTQVGTANTSANYGLFGQVDENTLLKNITITLGNNLELNQTNSVNTNFGVLAGTNNGIITNCFINGFNENRKTIKVLSSGSVSDVFNIAGLVGVNNGSISNSRVDNLQLYGKGVMAGFVSENFGEIASSFANNMVIVNEATSNEAGATAGFVAKNNNNARISTSYTGGAFAKFVDGKYEIEFSVGSDGRTQQIISTVNTGGFVYSNTGSISDCFAGSSLSVNEQKLGAVSGGFVYSNGTGGKIARCYSVTSAPIANKAHTPFVGPTSDYSGLNNQDEGSITSSYYYDSGFGTRGIELTKKLGVKTFTLKQFANKDNEQVKFWDEFSTSRSYTVGTELGEEFTSVWTFLSPENVYFNIKKFLPLANNSSTEYFAVGPRLVSADTIAVENWESVIYDQEKEIYTYSRGAYILNDKSYEINDFLTIDNGVYVVSPYLIDSAQTLYNLMKKDLEDDGKISNWYRLVDNIDLAELLPLGVDITLINNSVFQGNLEGNGFEISNLDISSGATENFGLFAEINNQNKSANNFASVQNLVIEVNDIAAALASKVGSLAGTIDSAVLGNIKVYSENTNTIIIGNNMVGGVAGKITGTSRVSNITSSISVSAVYGNSVTTKYVYNKDLLRLYGITDHINGDDVLCYSGAVFGVVDLVGFFDGNLNITTEEYDEARLSNIFVTGENKVIGTTSGGVVGLLGASTYATKMQKTVETEGYIKASRYGGGLIGENHGFLNNSCLVHSKAVQDEIDKSQVVGASFEDAKYNLFQGQSKAIGGLVGFNVGYMYDLQSGLIENSFNKVKVANTQARVAGGLVGIAMGGEINNLFVTSSVLSSRTGTTGGAFGVVCGIDDLGLDITDPFDSITDKFAYSGISDNEIFTTVSHIAAVNDWTYSDYNALKNIQENGSLGGFVGMLLRDKISENHTTLTNEKYELLVEGNKGISSSSEENFFVSEIYDYQPSKQASAKNGLIIHSTGVNISGDIASGLTRFEMFKYSYKNNKNQSSIFKQVDRMFENWPVYLYGTMIDEENKTYKIINYDNASMPIYDPQANPMEIEIWTVDDFLNIKNVLNANYVLKADIDFTGIKYVPIGSPSKPFTGSLTGTSYDKNLDREVTYVLSNISLPNDESFNTPSVGVFAYASGATIKDVVLSGINFSWLPSMHNSTSYAGLLTGYAEDTEISNVQILESHSRNDAVIENNKFTLSGELEYSINGTQIIQDRKVVANITDNKFTLGERHYTISGNNIIKTWSGENLLQTSAKYAGALSGSYSISSKERVLMNNIGIEADIVSADMSNQTIVISSSGEFTLGEKRYTIDASNSVFDENGMFVTSGSTFTIGNFVCTRVGNQITYNLISTPEVYLGGMIGYIEVGNNRQLDINNSYYLGDIKVERTSPLKAGGMVGFANNTSFTNDFVKSNLSALSLSYSVKVGGFAGELNSVNVANAMCSGDFGINVTTNNKDIYLGGFAGIFTGTAKNIVNSTNLTFKSLANWSIQSSGTNTQMIGGFVGSLGSDVNNVSLINIASLTTIYNFTLLDNVDGFAFMAPKDLNSSSNENVKNVYFDKYLSLSARDQFGFGENSFGFINYGSSMITFLPLDANDAYSVLKTGDGKYPRLNINPQKVNADFYTKYFDTFENTQKGTKLNPVQINDLKQFENLNSPGSLQDDENYASWASNWTTDEYKWYLQTNTILEVPLTSGKVLSGFYNADGNKIETKSYDSVYGQTITVNNMGIFDEVTSKSVVSGLEAQTVIYVGLKQNADRTNIGVICSTLSEEAIIFGSFTGGIINVLSTQQTSNVIGGLVASSKGQVIASGSTVDISIGADAGKYFVVGGLVGLYQNGTGVYALKDCYYSGKIKNNIQTNRQTFVGGLVGKIVQNVNTGISESMNGNAYMLNAYSSANIEGRGGALIGEWAGDNTYLKNVYYVDKIKAPLQYSNDVVGNYFDITSQRLGSDQFNTNYDITRGINYSATESTTAMTKGIWKTSKQLNYGLPFLKLQNDVIKTGKGDVSSPYLINNESQFVWAVASSESGNYYKLTRDMNYQIITSIYDTTLVDFEGILLGNGKYILDSTNVLLNSNQGRIEKLGFKGNVTTPTLVATSNSGTLSELYANITGDAKLFATSGVGSINNCMTQNFVIDNNGQTQTKQEIAYSSMLENENFNFINTWVLRPTVSGANQVLTTGQMQLRAFVESLDTLDVLGVTGSSSDIIGNGEFTLSVSSKEQYSAILQYIQRSLNYDKFNITLTNDIDMQGFKVPDLSAGKPVTININGQNNTLYNLIMDNIQDVNINAGLISTLYSGSITNLKFNQVNLMTETTGGIVVGEVRNGTLNHITISNSIVTGNSATEGRVGSVAGKNFGKILDVNLKTITIVANGGSVGGVVGENGKDIDVSSIDNLNIKQGTSNIASVGGIAGLVSNANSVITLTGVADIFINENSTNVGGMIGLSEEGSIINLTETATLNLVIQENSKNIGGLIGAVSTTTAGTITVGGTINITAQEVSNLGGLVGLFGESGHFTIYTSSKITEKEYSLVNINIQAADSSNIGGLFGFNDTSNLIITNNSDTTNFTNNINITLNGTNHNVGGIVGTNNGNLTSVNYNKTENGIVILGGVYDQNIGGFAGVNNGYIEASLNGVSINSLSTNIGGIAGLNGVLKDEAGTVIKTGLIVASVENVVIASLTDGNVDASNSTANYVGGLTGYNDGEISKSTISSVKIYANNFVGGIAGYNTGKLGDALDENLTTIKGSSVLGKDFVGMITSVNEGDINNIMLSDSGTTPLKVKYITSENKQNPYGFALSKNQGNITKIRLLVSQPETTLDLTELDTANNVGILAGENSGEIMDVEISEFTLKVLAQSQNVGTIGTNSGTIKKVSMSGVIIQNGARNLGIISGFNEGEIFDVSATYDAPKTWNLLDKSSNVGGLIGHNNGKTAILKIEGKLTIDGQNDSLGNAISTSNIGGVIGQNTKNLSDTEKGISGNLASQITVKGSNNIGGFVGFNSGTIVLSQETACVSGTNIVGENNVGGFVGENTARISGNANYVSTQQNVVFGLLKVGGFAGFNNTNSTLTNEGIYNISVSENKISSSSVNTSVQMGGLVGHNLSTIQGSKVTSTTVIARDEQNNFGDTLGGLVGENNGAVTSSQVTFSLNKQIVGRNDIGGIIGKNTTSVSNLTLCEVLSSDVISIITAHGENAGGIIGNNIGTLSVASVGLNNKIEANGVIGGIVGLNSGTIQSSITFKGILKGLITRESYALGGVAGVNTGTINSNITLGSNVSITGGIIIGGVAGLNTGSGNISASKVTFERLADKSKVLTINYEGATVYDYGGEHTNNYIDNKKDGSQIWFKQYFDDISNSIQTPSITSGNDYFLAVGRIVGATSSTNNNLCTITNRSLYELAGTFTSGMNTNDYLNAGYYLYNSGTYTLIKNSDQIKVGDTYYRGVVRFNKQGDATNYVAEQRNCGIN